MTEKAVVLRLDEAPVALQRIASLMVRLAEHEKVKAGAAAATVIEAGCVIETPEAMEEASDQARILKQSLNAIEEELRDSFRPLRDMERKIRDRVAPLQARLKAAIDKLDRERKRHDRVAQEKARELQRQQQEEANRAAAEARAAAAASAEVDEEPLPAAQVPVEMPERTTRGATATTARVRKVVAKEIKDPVAVARQWPHLLKLDTAAAKAEYDILIRRGTAEHPPEGGIVMGGILFVTETTFSDRAR